MHLTNEEKKSYEGLLKLRVKKSKNYDFIILKSHYRLLKSNGLDCIIFAINQETFDFTYTELRKMNSYFFGQYLDISELETFNVRNIRGYELSNNQEVINKKIGSFGKTILGGFLFGGLGAIAGSISGNNQTARTKVKNEYSVRLFLDKLAQSVIELKCDEINDAYRLLQTLSLLEEKYNEQIVIENKEIIEIEKVIHDDSNIEHKPFVDDLIRLKDLLEKGLITKDEFELLKNKIISES